MRRDSIFYKLFQQFPPFLNIGVREPHLLFTICFTTVKAE